MKVTSRFVHISLLLVGVVLFVNGCASSLQQGARLVPASQLLNDAAFSEYDSFDIEQADEIFALDDAAKAFVAKTSRGLKSHDEKVKQLMYRIFARADLDLIYEASANTVASETFKNASANCLSLSIMTFAMAKHAGFQSEFQIVDIPEYWTRRDGYSLLNGHINLRIRAKPRGNMQTLFENTFVVDFDPSTRGSQFSTSSVSEQTVLAMFYNNKAADALLQQKDAMAYAYLREAILTDDSYPGSWVNLGLLYRKTGDTDFALSAYQRAIQLDENYSTAWENLAVLYQQLGDDEAANEINRSLQMKRENNPFYHQMLAQIEREEGRLDNSILHYQKAIGLDSKQHQFYFGLAAVYFQKDDLDVSERFLKIAKRKAGNSRVADIYVDKLTALANFVANPEATARER